MNYAAKGLIVGTVAGILDVIPMLLQKLSWQACVSAFLFWVVAGFFIAKTPLRLPSALKGIVIAYFLLLPLAFVIGGTEPASLIPISINTLILGSLTGWVVSRWTAGQPATGS